MILFLNRPSIPLAPWSLLEVDSAQQGSQFLCRDLSPALFNGIVEWHLVRAFFQSLTPNRETIAVPIQNFDPILPTAGENKQVSGKGIQTPGARAPRCAGCQNSCAY